MVPSRRKIGLLIQSCLGAAALGAVALSGHAQSNPSTAAPAAQAATDPALQVESRFDGQRRRVYETNLPPVFGTRGSPPVGGGCQTNDPTNGQNYGVNFNVADNFNPAASGTLTAVSWSAVYQGTGGVDVAPPATETFRIRFFNDNAGLPGTQLGSTINLTNPTRTNSGTTLGASIIWDYQASIAGPAVTAGTCYWIEIKNTSTLGTGVGTFWLQGAPIPGDAISYQAFGIPCQNYQLLDQNPGDLSFCLNVPFNTLDGINCPALAAPAAPCTNPLANGNGLANNLGTGYSSISETSTYSGTGRFQRADLFRVGTGGTINQVCFWGFFLQQVAGGRTDSCIRDFDVIIWNLNPATLEPTTALHTRKVGTAFGGGTPTITSGLDAFGLEQFSISFPGGSGMAVSAATCYGLTISHRLVSTDPNRQAAFVWGGVQVPTTPNPVHDNKFWSRSISTAGVAGTWGLTQPPNTQTQNLSFLLNVGPMENPACVPPPANDLCSGAITLPLNGTPVAGSNVEATADAVAGCGFQLVERPAVWYTFVGTGNDVTITTCNAGTPSTADTMIGVYCANDCTGPFNCVGANDDAAAPACGSNAFASTVTVPTLNGQRYYVLVYHPIQKFVGTGFVARSPTPFSISATQGGASTITTTCAARANCVVDNDPFDIMETDNCGTGANDTNGTCATAVNYPTLGLIAKGQLATTGTVRDFDMWRLPASANGQNIEVRVQSETPVIIQVQNFNPDCTATPTVVAGFGLIKCIGLDVAAFDATLPASGINIVLILPPSFDGLPCPPSIPPIPENSQNDYRLVIDVAAIGACCIPFTACSQETFTDCATAAGGDPQAFWAEGVPCTPDPCASQPGRCCFPDASCQVVPSVAVANSTVCSTSGGTYTAGGVCTPNTCPSAAMIACCQGATCAMLAPSACTGPNTLNSGAGACNAPGNNTTPCCKANFNQAGGVTVQDLFDYLSAYFGGSPLADVNGNGVTVQDLFDYLALYFAGCP